jgi:hypothetical protein
MDNLAIDKFPLKVSYQGRDIFVPVPMQGSFTQILTLGIDCNILMRKKFSVSSSR